MNKKGSKTGHLEIKMKMFKYEFFDIFPFQYNISLGIEAIFPWQKAFSYFQSRLNGAEISDFLKYA